MKKHFTIYNAIICAFEFFDINLNLANPKKYTEFGLKSYYYRKAKKAGLKIRWGYNTVCKISHSDYVKVYEFRLMERFTPIHLNNPSFQHSIDAFAMAVDQIKNAFKPKPCIRAQYERLCRILEIPQKDLSVYSMEREIKEMYSEWENVRSGESDKLVKVFSDKDAAIVFYKRYVIENEFNRKNIIVVEPSNIKPGFMVVKMPYNQEKILYCYLVNKN